MSPSALESPRVEIETESETVTLQVPSQVRFTISPKDFWTLCTRNKLPRLERTASGELVVMSPAGNWTGSLELEVGSALLLWSKRNRSGVASGSNGGFTLPNSAVRAADAGWMSDDRWNSLTETQQAEIVPLAPDFAVEICSTSDNRKVTQAKMVEDLEQGVRPGWLIDARPPEYEVEIYRPGQAVEILSRPETLSGGDVLPGVVLELGKIVANAC